MIDELAEAVRDQLNLPATQAVFAPLAFTARFDDSPKLDPMPNDLTVIVTPNNVMAAPQRSNVPGQPVLERFRGIQHYQYILSVFIAQKGPATATPDPLQAWSKARRKLVEQVVKFFSAKANATPTGNYILQSIHPKPLYDIELLMNQRSFLSMLVLTYDLHERP